MKKFYLGILLCGLFMPIRVSADTSSLQDSRKHLVVDHRAIPPTAAGEFVYGTPTKHPKNPLIHADQPWENSLNNLYANVVFDSKANLFKMWYGCVLADKDAIAKMESPSTVHDVGWYELYATSRDGVRWNRPAVGLHAFAESKANNAVTRDTPNVGVFRDTNPNGPPDRLYKMIYDIGQGKMRVRFSADGIHWQAPLEAKGLGPRTGDTHNNAFWDSRLKKYVLITRIYLGERLVARAESEDFLHWKDEKIVLRSTLDEGKDRQTYCMPTFAYGSSYLGFVMMYNVGTDRTVDCELAWSPDSVHWKRVAPGVPFLPRGNGASYDSKCIYAQANPPILREGLLHLYYGGSDVPHVGWKRHCHPCLATLPVDRFVGIRSRDPITPLRLATRPMKWSSSDLQVSADVEKGGSVEVSLTTPQGQVLAESEPIQTNTSDHLVRWKSPPKTIREEALVLVFRLDRATLYAFRGPELVPTVAKEPTSPSRRLSWDQLHSGERKTVVKVETNFHDGTEGWQAIGESQYQRDVAQDNGFLRVRRADGQPYGFASLKSSQGRFTGDWQKQFGGTGVRISFKVRAARPMGATRVEIFAKEISQWSYDRLPKATTEWQTFSVTVRHDWTDAEAEAAGWHKAGPGFPWRDTLTHVGRLLMAPMVEQSSSASYDLDDVRIETIFDE